MRILLAGPGTGKTTGIKRLIEDEFDSDSRILVLSFTNATVSDLRESFEDYDNVSCHTLHSYALRIIPDSNLYVLSEQVEHDAILSLAKDFEVGFDDLCQQLGCISFDNMVEKGVRFLGSNPVYGQDVIGPLDLLIVDEYQDFNANERALVEQISKFSGETIILGDDDQSIYGFKDADPEGILSLYYSDEVDKIPHANNCYRCPDVIVKSATSLIRHNKNRVDKEWNPTGIRGDLFRQQVHSQADCADFIVDRIKEIQAAEKQLEEGQRSTFLLLSPMKFHVDLLMERLDAEGIPYVDFWTPQISAEQFSRIWQSKVALRHRPVLNMIFLLKELSPHFKNKFKNKLKDSVQTGRDMTDLLPEMVDMFKGNIGQLISNQLTLDELSTARPEWNEITDLVDPEDISGSLDAITKKLKPEREFDSEAVNVMSIHKSKGLQASIVFISGLTEGVVPNSKRGLDTIEAQRRLLFVGMTRARKSLYLLSPVEWDASVVHRVDKDQFKYDFQSKKYKGPASSFLAEL